MARAAPTSSRGRVPWTARAPPMWPAFALGVAWLLQRAVPLPWGVPDAVRGLGVGLLFAGLGVAGWAMVAMRRAGTSPEPWHEPRALVTHGPYAHTRNPIYLGYLLAFPGLGLALGWWWALAATLLAWLLLDRLVVRHEEARMRSAFPSAWEAYEARVPRWGWRSLQERSGWARSAP